MAFSFGPIQQIKTDVPTVYAFKVTGRMTDDASEALAKVMNIAFDQHKKVNLLLDLSGFTGSDWDSLFDDDVIESRFRALKHVSRYAVVGAPERANRMIGFLDKIIPVDARAFSVSETGDAWTFVGARPVDEATGAAAMPAA
ncbi:STAS/SEC14 domain-containing protein [Flavimaricola marinus]|uniref:STAS/SEC14 domain-containing protein n=1 Tax=Flavimaricola marinus TaxID=1819565 RepID=A0A238LBD1_9RHOB|nr:STAS/SEC14 domain-containing protein [Flavimaricola marinus]SMY06938.1 hypothetical protein LOM8899_01068 [Flavimaricola marinus]